MPVPISSAEWVMRFAKSSSLKVDSFSFVCISNSSDTIKPILRLLLVLTILYYSLLDGCLPLVLTTISMSSDERCVVFTTYLGTLAIGCSECSGWQNSP